MATFIKRVLILVVILGLVGVVYQWMATRRDRAQYPPPGQLYTVNEQQLHLFCMGEASAESPTVIIESGRASSTTNWLSVMDQVSQTNHVCTYDRPGLGWSEPSPTYLEAAEVTVNLHDLLVSAEISPPYLMVGHSIGGILVRDFYQRYPQLVEGIVLVDSAYDNQYGEVELHDVVEVTMLKASVPFGQLASRAGLLRIYRQFRNGQNDAGPEKAAELARRSETHYFRADAGEMLLTWPLIARLEPIKSLGSLPLRVLEQTIATGPHATPEHIATKVEWHQFQTTLAALSTESVLIEAPQSGHNIPDHDPGLVANTITDLLDAIRNP